MAFRDRRDAGRRLAAALTGLHGDPVVLGLPRGGIPVAAEVARSLHADLDVIVVRKLGVPGQPELAMGAIGEDGVEIVNEDVARAAGVTRAQWAEVRTRERAELARRVARFRGERPRLDLRGRVAVLVDDGIATGATARAACQVARAHGVARLVVAAPVASAAAIEALRSVADDVVCLASPPGFRAVGDWYEDFRQVTDDDVVAVLRTEANPAPCRETTVTGVQLRAGSARLPGTLAVPADAEGIVVFAHGSGSSRHSPRNQLVADVLNLAGLATLLFDLLTPEEAVHRANVFDVDLLGRRLAEVTRALRHQPETRDLGVGYFGASTGAGAAVWAAAEPDLDVAAVVSRGGRPDLAGPRLTSVRAPVLLIVGALDEAVLGLNRRAADLLQCPHRLQVVPGASHLFEEPGTLQVAAGLARDWFTRYLPARAVAPGPAEESAGRRLS